MEAHEFLIQKLGELTRESYLLGYAVAQLATFNPHKIESELQTSISELLRKPDELKIDSIEMSPNQIQEVVKYLPVHLGQILITNLDSFLHAFLDKVAGRIDENAVQFETDLAIMWPRGNRGEKAWAYKEVILMAEVRNSIVHGNGELQDARRQRLQDAEWTDDEINRVQEILKTPSFDDFLRFKRAVRTVSNAVLDACGLRQE
jgi:hypothetical protein